MYKTLVLSSGSFRGFQYVGALKVLEERNLVKGFKEYVGVSIGALFSLFMTLQYTSNEIEDIIMSLDLRSIMFPNILKLSDTYGIIDTNEVIVQIKSFLSRKNVPQEITFKQLHERYDTTLNVYTTKLGRDHESVKINHETMPDLEVWKGVLMSMSIPFVFPPVEYNGNYYIDGGIKSNFPVQQYKSTETLGIFLEENLDFHKNDPLSNYSMLVYMSLYPSPVDREKYKVITLRTELGTLDFFVDNETKQSLFAQGYEQTNTWFKAKIAPHLNES